MDRPETFALTLQQRGKVVPRRREHPRARLLETVIGPLILNRTFDSAEASFKHMSACTAVLAIQSGERGPMAQVIAGVDLAIWDLLACRVRLPLGKLLGGTSDVVPVYAWGLTTALHMADRLRELAPAWPEEPLRADRPISEWQALASSTRIPLAAGENLIGAAAFESMIDSGALRVVQPDLAKWGGISGNLPVIERIHETALRHCPHFLGAGIGQLASAHMLAARERPGGMLEVDANNNPLRSALSPAIGRVRDGVVQLGDRPGLGIDPDIAELGRLCEMRA